MNVSLILSATGILLNLFGIVFLFAYALSPHLKAMDKGKAFFGTNQEEPTIYKKRVRQKVLSWIGLLLCVIGLTLQLVSLFV